VRCRKKLLTIAKRKSIERPNGSVVTYGMKFTEISDDVWLVSFMEYDLGYFDGDNDRIAPADNPFLPKVLPMSSE